MLCDGHILLHLIKLRGIDVHERIFLTVNHLGFDEDGTLADLFRAIEADLEWLSVPYGKVVVFSQTLMHGNRVNREKDSRWSMNCRFKGVFSPYGDKKLGEFFEPITLRAASRMGLDYEFPGGGLKAES